MAKIEGLGAQGIQKKSDIGIAPKKGGFAGRVMSAVSKALARVLGSKPGAGIEKSVTLRERTIEQEEGAPRVSRESGVSAQIQELEEKKEVIETMMSELLESKLETQVALDSYSKFADELSSLKQEIERLKVLGNLKKLE